LTEKPISRQERVTVVVPTWRRATWLEGCLSALARQSRPPDQVLVVGRADDAAARAVAQRAGSDWQPVTRWVEVDRPGHIAPLKAGLEAADGNFVAFLDDDTEPEPGWLLAFLDVLADPNVGCAGGRVVTRGQAGRVNRNSGRVEWYGRFVGNVGEREDPGPVTVDSVMECNWAWRREVLLKLAFDPVLDYDDASMYGLDLCLQAKELGYRTVYVPSARVAHHVAPRDPELDRAQRPLRMLSYSRNFTYISLKHLPPARRLIYVAWWWLIGDRGSYGALMALVELATRRRQVPALARASMIGKWRGLRAWRDRSAA
jgi:GT2 family glycosyltransferase